MASRLLKEVYSQNSQQFYKDKLHGLVRIIQEILFPRLFKPTNTHKASQK